MIGCGEGARLVVPRAHDLGRLGQHRDAGLVGPAGLDVEEVDLLRRLEDRRGARRRCRRRSRWWPRRAPAPAPRFASSGEWGSPKTPESGCGRGVGIEAHVVTTTTSSPKVSLAAIALQRLGQLAEGQHLASSTGFSAPDSKRAAPAPRTPRPPRPSRRASARAAWCLCTVSRLDSTVRSGTSALAPAMSPTSITVPLGAVASSVSAKPLAADQVEHHLGAAAARAAAPPRRTRARASRRGRRARARAALPRSSFVRAAAGAERVGLAPSAPAAPRRCPPRWPPRESAPTGPASARPGGRARPTR